MAIYLDQKRRCDNCHAVISAPGIACKGETAYMCHKELCERCQSKQDGWCQDCFKDEIGFIYDGEDEDKEQARRTA